MKLLVLVFLTISLYGYSSGEPGNLKPEKKTAVYFDVTPPLSQMRMIKPVKKKVDSIEMPNKIGHREFERLETNVFPFSEDGVWQKQNGTYLPYSSSMIQNFEGIDNISGYYPPDTQGDIGPDNYVQVVNASFAVYSKTGNLLMGPLLLKTIWAGIPAPWNGTNNGDPVVLYDQLADRWIISQISLPYGSSGGSYAELVAVSQTSDPAGSWYRYVFPFGNILPDYPRLAIWPDGYYMSVNQFLNGCSWSGVGACAFERTKMLAGDPSASMVYFDLGVSGDPASMIPSDWDGTTPPMPGEPNHFIYMNDWTPGTTDYLKIWDFHVDWNTPANSTISEACSLPASSFDSDICTSNQEKCIPQPGTAIKLEAVSDRLMYRLQYRNFGNHRSMVTNHTVDADGSGHAGIRWYELRNTGSGWNIHQQGTYAPDGTHRWVGSVAMNGSGDIALGYSVSDGIATYPGIRYTGRKANDEPGIMTFAEQTIIDGTGSQTGTQARWGDYSMMSVDPSDDKTFWYTTEYVQITGTTTWKTRVASFKLPDLPSVITLPAENITPSSATLKGEVSPNGFGTIYHFEYGASTAYGTQTAAGSAGAGTSLAAVSAAVGGLISGTMYHYRLVSENSEGTSYGKDIIFIPGGIVLTTSLPAVIGVNSAGLGGNVLADGGLPVLSRGICWSESANPVITGNHLANGSGTGIYTITINGLSSNTLYHARAYATNQTGTYYGNEVAFTTLCDSFALPFAEGFSTNAIPNCWSQADFNNNGQVWQFGTIPFPPYPALNGSYAYLDSENYGPWGSQNADLITPAMDLTNMASVVLSFDYYFWFYESESGTVSYSVDNGLTWEVITSFTTTSANPAHFTETIPAVAGHSQVKFKWNYTGEFGWYFAIDEVNVNGLPVNRQLSDIVVPDAASYCYSASQAITVAGSGTSFTVEVGGNATLIAGQQINLLQGTSVRPGGFLHGYIDPSGTYCTNQGYLPVVAGSNDQYKPRDATADNEDFFEVYPNPTTGSFTIRMNTVAVAEKIRVEIFSMTGERVLSEALSGGTKYDLSLRGTPAGIYLIRMISDKASGTARIIRQ